MAKEFDIYLREHLTECDLLVYSIPYHDGLSVTNRLILDTALNSYILQKFAAVQMKSALVAHIDEMIKLCCEKLSTKTVLGASATFEARSKLYIADVPIIINTPSIEIVERIMNEAENGLVLAIEPLVTQIATSTGRGDLPLLVDASVDSTFKRDLLSPRAPLTLGASVTQVNQVDYIETNTQTVVDASLQSLCYNLTFDSSSALRIVALVLGTEIRHSLGRWYDGVSIGSRVRRTSAQKFIIAQTVAAIMQEATGKLIKVLYPDDSATAILVDDINAGLKRCRLLSELDGETDDSILSDYDDMTLGDLDYVILQE